MGFTVPQLKANSKAPLEEGTYQVELLNFQHGESSKKKTPYVSPVFKVVDDDALNADGEPWKGKLFTNDNFYITETALWRLKKLASETGVELPEAGEEFETLGEYAKAVTDAFDGAEGTLTVEHESYEDKDGNERIKHVVVEYNLS